MRILRARSFAIGSAADFDADARGEKLSAYIPLGVGVVIPPWNFAAAIMGGMTIASIVTGNTAIVKPSSDSPTIAAIFVNILYEAGVPRDVVSFFTGPGARLARLW